MVCSNENKITPADCRHFDTICTESENFSLNEAKEDFWVPSLES